MEHRHLNHDRLTLAAIDDIIRRGGLEDWVRLARAMKTDASVPARIERVCAAPTEEQAQSIQFWRLYARHHAERHAHSA